MKKNWNAFKKSSIFSKFGSTESLGTESTCFLYVLHTLTLLVINCKCTASFKKNITCEHNALVFYSEISSPYLSCRILICREMVTKLTKHYLTSSEFVDLQTSQTSLDSIHQILSIATQLPSDITFNKLTNLIQQIDQSYSTNWPITFNKLTNHIQQIDQSHSTNWSITFNKLTNHIQQINNNLLKSSSSWSSCLLHWHIAMWESETPVGYPH